MSAQHFINLCLDLMISGLNAGLAVAQHAKRINERSEMDMAWLVSTLYDFYRKISCLQGQMQRLYQFLAAGNLYFVENQYRIYIYVRIIAPKCLYNVSALC